MESTSRVSLIRIPQDNGMTGYMLEYYPPLSLGEGKILQYERLNVESYTNPCNDIETRYNGQVEIIVEEIRCTRYIQAVSRDYSFLRMNKELDAIHYLETNVARGDRVGDAAVKSFRRFCKNKCSFGDITASYLMAYRSFLLNACKKGKTRRYSNNTASSYLKHIKSLLAIAYNDRLIDFNPHEAVPGITWDHTIRKERLTDQEIDAIKRTPYKYQQVKQAALFSIFTGLRRSDVLNLKWENIEYDGERYYMSITIKKTGNKVRLPLSGDAVETLGTMRKTGQVFPFVTNSILVHCLPELMVQAGIAKHITFHCFRHTFAMRLLDNNVDIVTIAFLLGHKFKGSALSYLNCSREHLEKVIDKLESLAGTDSVYEDKQ